jgi:hypothetical protein
MSWKNSGQLFVFFLLPRRAGAWLNVLIPAKSLGHSEIMSLAVPT